MSYDGNPFAVEALYRAYMDKYTRDTRFLSFTKYEHPAFKAILNLGEPAVPFLLKDVQSQHPDGSFTPGKKDFSFWAAISLLYQIVPDAPTVPEEARGRLSLLRALWVNWGLQRGYLSDADEPTIPFQWGQLYRLIPRKFFGTRNYVWRLTTLPNRHRMKHSWDLWRAV